MLGALINYKNKPGPQSFYSAGKVNSALLCALLAITRTNVALGESQLPAPDTTADDQPSIEEPVAEPAGAEEKPVADDLEWFAPEPEVTDWSAELDACDRIKDLDQSDATWYDAAHAYMNTAFCEPAVYFDYFFASDRVLEEVAGSYVRWRNDFIQVEGQGFDFNTNLNFSIELPKVSSKLKLIFEGDEDPALQDVLPGTPAQAQDNNLGLRLDVKDTDRSKFNISVSAKPRIRLRYRYTYPVREDFIIRFTQEVQNEEGVNGARSRLDFEKAFLPFRLFRSTTELFATEDLPGAEVSQAFVLFKRTSRRSSMSYEASAVGITEPLRLVTSYRLGVRYRRSIHRDWLFFEVSPDITWPVRVSEDRATVLEERRSVLSLLVRIEVHFGNAQRRKYSDFY